MSPRDWYKKIKTSAQGAAGEHLKAGSTNFRTCKQPHHLVKNLRPLAMRSGTARWLLAAALLHCTATRFSADAYRTGFTTASGPSSPGYSRSAPASLRRASAQAPFTPSAPASAYSSACRQSILSLGAAKRGRGANVRPRRGPSRMGQGRAQRDNDDDDEDISTFLSCPSCLADM